MYGKRNMWCRKICALLCRARNTPGRIPTKPQEVSMYFRNKSDEYILDRCRTVIDNSLSDAEILEAVGTYGYDQASLQRGKALFEEASDQYHNKVREYDEQYASSRRFRDTFARAHDHYMDCVKVARVVYKNDPDTYQRLGVFGERTTRFPDWLPQVRGFYDGALGDSQILGKLSNWGITRKRLEAGVELVEEAVAASDAQQRESGEAQQATQEKNAAIDTLYEWTSDYLTIAEIALKDKLQLLEKLGIVVES